MRRSTALPLIAVLLASCGGPAIGVVSPTRERATTDVERACPEAMARIERATLPLHEGSPMRGVPAHGAVLVLVASFCLDRTEFTVDAYAACVAAGACRAAAATISYAGDGRAQTRSPTCNAARSDVGAHPINCVDWHQASAYCAWRGARLPSELEWELAVRGAEGRSTPWGEGSVDARHANLLGSETPHELVPVPRRAPFDDGHAGTAPVGSFPHGASPEGVHDLAGNVAEWCVAADPSASRQPQRGASWMDDALEPAMVGAHLDPRERDENAGFRCAADLGS